jgi:small subunit ribosomal protein S7
MEQRKLDLFINYLMKKGNKQKGKQILQKTLQEIQLQTKQDGIVILEKAFQRSNPYFKLRTVKKSGAQGIRVIPLTLMEQERLSIKWLIDSARRSRGKTLSNKLARQIVGAAENNGDMEVIKRIREFHRLVESSRY